MGSLPKKSNDVYIYIIIGVICILAYLGYRYIKSTQEDIIKVTNELNQCKENINHLSDFILQNNQVLPENNEIHDVINNTEIHDDINNNEIHDEINNTENFNNTQFTEVKEDTITPSLQNIESKSVKDSEILSIFSDNYSRQDEINNLDDFIVSMNKKETSKKQKAVRKRKPRKKKTEEVKEEPKIEEVIEEPKTEEKNEL